MKRAFVVMANDFPDCVFAQKQPAQDYVTYRREEENAKRGQGFRYIHWGYYEVPFEDGTPLA